MRVGLALAQASFPFASLGEMTGALARISSRFPQHAERCRQLVEQRGRQGV